MTSIRPADDGDMAAVAELWHEGWHDGHAGHVPDGLTAARTLAAFHERTPSRVADTTVAVSDDGELLGFVMVVDDEVEQVFVGRSAPDKLDRVLKYVSITGVVVFGMLRVFGSTP